MSKAGDLLNSVSSTRSSTLITVTSVEAHIVIGTDRSITVPEELKRLAVQYDHDIETVTFDCPRYWDNNDMSTMSIYINYLCPDQSTGSYIAQNVRVDTKDEYMMHFDWTISKNVTIASGNLTFMVCIKKNDDTGNEVKHWNSELCTDCIISKGFEYDGEIIKELYPDIVEQYLEAALKTGYKGEKGDKGDKGDKGARGATGAQGPKGDKGDPYTLTDDDKRLIVSEVLVSLPTWEGGSY